MMSYHLIAEVLSSNPIQCKLWFVNMSLNKNTLIGTSWVFVKLIKVLVLWGGLLAHPDFFMNLMNYEFVTLH